MIPADTSTAEHMTTIIRSILSPLLVLAVLAATTAAQTPDRARLAADVRMEFLHAWQGYKTYAWGHDGLRPLSRTPFDWYGTSFLMTPVDALDTMILMGLAAEADSTREYIATHLSFDRDVYVKTFEFTIRLIGGLLSSYEMTGDPRLLTLARDLGDRLLPVFSSPTGMPYVEVNLKAGAVRGDTTNPAEIGTLMLEFGTLSRHTHDMRYARAARRAVDRLFALRSPIGLVGDAIDITTGRWVSTDSHIGGCIDSYYEYLVKASILFHDSLSRSMWDTSNTAIQRNLRDSSSAGFWYGHANMNTGLRTQTLFGSLDAFFPAVLVLAGDVPDAKLLEESCFRMWTRYGIEPELTNYRTMSAVSPDYHLRPEIIESAYYLYQATHDDRYIEMGEQFFNDLRTYCRTEAGFAELESVVSKKKADMMESFFLAETLKYLYLLFAPDHTLQFESVIFNTEAHPLKRIN